MKKSVYSLVLADEIIEAIDAMAYAQGTSRSNLVNQLLAQSLSLTTPQDQIREMFTVMEKIFDSYHPFKLSPQSPGGNFQIKSVLKYKYNPTIRYTVTFYTDQTDVIGEIKLVSRTQNESLQEGMNSFFDLWSRLEEGIGQKGWRLEEVGRWSKELSNPRAREYTEEERARAVAFYIKRVDEAMKAYCKEIQDPISANQQIYHHFSYYVNHTHLKV